MADRELCGEISGSFPFPFNGISSWANSKEHDLALLYLNEFVFVKRAVAVAGSDRKVVMTCLPTNGR